MHLPLAALYHETRITTLLATAPSPRCGCLKAATKNPCFWWLGVRTADIFFFNSDRSGQPGLWAERVNQGTPAGEPVLVMSNLDVGRGMGTTRDGTLHYPVRVSRRRLKIAEIDMKTGKLLRQPSNLIERFVGGNSRGVTRRCVQGRRCEITSDSPPTLRANGSFPKC